MCKTGTKPTLKYSCSTLTIIFRNTNLSVTKVQRPILIMVWLHNPLHMLKTCLGDVTDQSSGYVQSSSTVPGMYQKKMRRAEKCEIEIRREHEQGDVLCLFTFLFIIFFSFIRFSALATFFAENAATLHSSMESISVCLDTR